MANLIGAPEASKALVVRAQDVAESQSLVFAAAAKISGAFAGLWSAVSSGATTVFSAVTGTVSWPIVIGLILGAGLVYGYKSGWFKWNGRDTTDALIAEVLAELRAHPMEGATKFRQLVRRTPDAVCKLLTLFDAATVGVLISESSAMTPAQYMKHVTTCRETGHNEAVSPVASAKTPRSVKTPRSAKARQEKADADAANAALVATKLLELLDRTIQVVSGARRVPLRLKQMAGRLREASGRLQQVVDGKDVYY